MTAFVGFNAYVQHSDVHEGEIKKLQDLGKLMVAPSWSYIAFVAGNCVILKGFLGTSANELKEYRTNGVITSISSCDNFCLILLENGCLFKLKPIKNAKLEEIKFALLTDESQRKRTTFGEQKQLKPIRINYACCGNTISVAVSNRNVVYNIPNPIHQFDMHFRVQQLECGFEHAILLCGKGDVFSWGYGLRGQLGHDSLRVEEKPKIINALAGVKIIYVAAGGWHSAAISAFGDLYTWGYNSNGQLAIRVLKCDGSGLKTPVVYPLPQYQDLLVCCRKKNLECVDEHELSCSPVKVFAGARHTVLQMSCGSVLGTGWNKYGQLHLNDTTDWKDSFVDIDIQCGKVLECYIVTGPWCTIVFNQNKNITM